MRAAVATAKDLPERSASVPVAIHSIGTKYTNDELINAIKAHFKKMNKTSFQAFHYIDRNRDHRINAKEIKEFLSIIGYRINTSRARELLRGFSRGGYTSSELDVQSFMRLWQSAKKPTKSKKTEKKEYTNKELIEALQEHFRTLGLSNVKGFYYIDKDDSKRLNSEDIRNALAEAGVQISFDRAHELIRSYALNYSNKTHNFYAGEMDVHAFIRFMASIYRQFRPKSR